MEVVEQDRGKVETGFEVLRIDLDGPVEVGHRLGHVGQLEVGQSQVVVGFSGIAVQLEHLVLENPARYLQIPLEHVDKATGIERHNVGRLHSQHVLHKVLGSGDRVDLPCPVFLRSRFHQPVKSQRVVYLHIVRFLNDNLVEQRLGLVLQFRGLAKMTVLRCLTGLGQVHLADVRLGRTTAGVGVQRLLVDLQRLFAMPLSLVHHPQIEVGFQEVLVLFDRLLKCRSSSRVVRRRLVHADHTILEALLRVNLDPGNELRRLRYHHLANLKTASQLRLAAVFLFLPFLLGYLLRSRRCVNHLIVVSDSGTRGGPASDNKQRCQRYNQRGVLHPHEHMALHFAGANPIQTVPFHPAPLLLRFAATRFTLFGFGRGFLFLGLHFLVTFERDEVHLDVTSPQ